MSKEMKIGKEGYIEKEKKMLNFKYEIRTKNHEKCYYLQSTPTALKNVFTTRVN